MLRVLLMVGLFCNLLMGCNDKDDAEAGDSGTPAPEADADTDTDADTAADQERFGPFGMRNESATNRTYRTDEIAWSPVAERIETMTNSFE